MVGPFSLLYLSARPCSFFFFLLLEAGKMADGKKRESGGERIKVLELRSSESVGFDKTWFTNKGPTRVFTF